MATEKASYNSVARFVEGHGVELVRRVGAARSGKSAAASRPNKWAHGFECIGYEGDKTVASDARSISFSR